MDLTFSAFLVYTILPSVSAVAEHVTFSSATLISYLIVLLFPLLYILYSCISCFVSFCVTVDGVEVGAYGLDGWIYFASIREEALENL